MNVPPRLRWLVEPGSPAVELGRRFDAAGHQLYLVGGSLRDALLDRPHDDLDFATDAHPDAVRRVVAGWALETSPGDLEITDGRG